LIYLIQRSKINRSATTVRAGDSEMAEKKVDPHAIKPNKNLPFIAGGMILFALAWLIYSINPGVMIRAETEQEKKERISHEKEEADFKKSAARAAEKEARRPK
jgi:hypothetical protein